MLEIAEWMGGLPLAELGGFIIPVLCTILGGGGIWALLSARAGGRAVERAAFAAAQATERAASAAASATERAAVAAAIPQVHAAVTADWSALMNYWQAEMLAMRTKAAELEVRVLFLEHQREDDLAHIDALEQHIWNALPPPPPPRRIRRPSDNQAP